MPASSLHQIERGARRPNVEQIRTLSFLYNVPVQHFYTLMEPDLCDDPAVAEARADFLTLRRKAAVFRETDQPSRYLACLLRCEEVVEDTGSLVWVRRARATALRERGQTAEAAGLLLDLLSRPGLPAEEVAGIWLDASRALTAQGNLEVAEAAARRGLSRCTDDDALTRLHLQTCLGRVLVRRARGSRPGRRAREAVRLLETSRDGFRELGLDEEAAVAELDLGVAHLAEGSRVHGFSCLRRGLAACHKAGFRPGLARAHLLLGRAHLEDQGEEDARQHLIRSEALAAGGGDHDLQFRSLALLCALAERRGGSAAAFRRRAQALLPWLTAASEERDRFEALLRGGAHGTDPTDTAPAPTAEGLRPPRRGGLECGATA